MNILMLGCCHLDTRRILGAEGPLPPARIGPHPSRALLNRALSEMGAKGRESSSESGHLVLARHTNQHVLGVNDWRPRASGFPRKSGNTFILGNGCSHSAQHQVSSLSWSPSPCPCLGNYTVPGPFGPASWVTAGRPRPSARVLCG